MNSNAFKAYLYLPAQAAAETEATILKWFVSPGEAFTKGKIIAEAESAKSTFEFEAPCDGTVTRRLAGEGETIAIDKAVLEIETLDETMKKNRVEAVKTEVIPAVVSSSSPTQRIPIVGSPVSLLGLGAYLPKQIITNKDILVEFPDITDDYIFGVTGIRERRYAAIGEKPSDMAAAAAADAIKKSGLTPSQIGAIILSTTTPDVVMPSTACIVGNKLGIRNVPMLDLNAACAGWLYSIMTGRGLIMSGMADNVLVIAVDMQSRLLDKKDKDTCFLFGDGAGAVVLGATDAGHRIVNGMLTADPEGLRMARREFPGFEVPANSGDCDPWIRLDGKALFRAASETFSSLIRKVSESAGWQPGDVTWVVPHQANSRIIKAAAQKCGVPFERFFLNIDHVGNTSSASIPVATVELEKYLRPHDKVVFCAVGAGVTAGAIALEW